jgi:hypothetical protein
MTAFRRQRAGSIKGVKMRRPMSLLLLAGLVVSGCATRTAEAPAPVPVQPTYSLAGLEAVMGSTAAAIVAQFGRPDLEVREGSGRKLQFLSPVCVLDAYLYPPRRGGEPVVTHIDARLPDGREMDRSSCVAAISRRGEAR